MSTTRTIESEIAKRVFVEEGLLTVLIALATGEPPDHGQQYTRAGKLVHVVASIGDGNEDEPDHRATGPTERLALLGLCEAIGLIEEENDEGRHPLTQKALDLLDNAAERAGMRANAAAVQ